MEDEKRRIFGVHGLPCPNCSKAVSPAYTKRELETGLREGEVPVYCIFCQYSWKRKLEPQEKVKLKNDLDSGELFP